jgi:D-alanyl-D-alanine carboxypeptidase/D-alanyl-D-alanine-endopeptidase (penicillin-binding protein 4)
MISAIAVAFALLATGSVFAGVAVGSADAARPAPVATTDPPRPVPSAASTAAALRTCSINGAASVPQLGSLNASVINTTTGEVLFDRAGDAGVATASVMKVLTATTALGILGPDYRFTTTVYAGSTPGSVVLVGGGDATLSRLPTGQESVYRGAPKLADLAAQVKTQWEAAYPEQEITSVVLDATMWNPADNWDPSWPASERTQGYQPLITALMVDGDRANPAAQDSPRSTDPVMAAGQAFVAALDLPSDTPISTGSAITSNPQLGQVQSQPVSTLIGQMLPNSDNTLAEMMARVSSKAGGRDGSSASLTGVYQSKLTELGLTATSLVIKDGSGESNLNQVPASFVARLMTVINANPAGKNLEIIYGNLPVSGASGTLASRFTGANTVAKGAINAKTGWIATTQALAGIVHAQDGTALSFAFFAGGKLNVSQARTALDTLATATFLCGNNLSNN